MALSPDLRAAPKLARTDAGLQPYVPSPDQPWDTLRAGHLLRRTLIGPQPSEIAQALRSTPHQVVKNLLFLPNPPDPPGDWVNQAPFIRPTRAQRRLEREWMDEIRAWWMEKMVNLTPTSRGFSIRERMVPLLAQPLCHPGHRRAKTPADVYPEHHPPQTRPGQFQNPRSGHHPGPGHALLPGRTGKPEGQTE